VLRTTKYFKRNTRFISSLHGLNQHHLLKYHLCSCQSATHQKSYSEIQYDSNSRVKQTFPDTRYEDNKSNQIVQFIVVSCFISNFTREISFYFMECWFIEVLQIRSNVTLFLSYTINYNKEILNGLIWGKYYWQFA
jgi:hypothetical protein